jgi:hypothetical protein
MLAVNQINYLVHDDLYSYGLHFSYQWAMPYWGFSGAIMALSLTNIVLSLIAALHVTGRGRIGETISEDKDARGIKSIDDFDANKKQLKLKDFPSMEKSQARFRYEYA